MSLGNPSLHPLSLGIVPKGRRTRIGTKPYLLCLIIDEQSMLSSKMLAAAERNVRECVFRGQNSKEIWGGVPVVLHLFPVIDKGAIQG